MEISTPGRVCLFGEHQDYLGLPVIAMAISLRSVISGISRNDTSIIIRKPDINETEKFDLDKLNYHTSRDYFKSGIKVCKDFGFKFSRGFECEIRSEIPIKAGTSSSSSIMVGWINFLSQNADNPKILDTKSIAELAYKAEVIEFDSPGGMMDQYSTSVGNLIYLESEPEIKVKRINRELGAFVLGDSLEQKDTIGILSRCRDSRLSIMSEMKNFDPDVNFQTISSDQLDQFELDDEKRHLMIGTIKNRDLLLQAKVELKKPNLDQNVFGRLLHDHHKVLSECLKVSTPKIEYMLKSAMEAGAFGGKINGSGGGGCMFAYCPEDPERVKLAIENVGGSARIVYAAAGTRVVSKG